MISRLRTIFYCLCIVIFLALCFYHQAGKAQSPGDWEPAAPLPGSQETEPNFPIIIGDEFGGVHVFWSSNDGYIYYSVLDYGNWTEPIEILSGGGVPSAVVDSIGRIHLIWKMGQNLAYSWAPVDKARDAKAWAEPVTITRGVSAFSMVMDLQNRIHVVYQLREQDPGSEQDPGCYYTSSNDLGLTWQVPTLLMQQPELPEVGTDVFAVDIATDRAGRIHILFSSISMARMYYARSSDHGQTWEDPIEIYPSLSVETGNIGQIQTPSIATNGEDEVHLFFFGRGDQGEPCARYHQMSRDGGLSWTDLGRILGKMFNCTGPVGWAVDGNNVLHIVSSGRGGFAPGVPMYTSYWDGAMWSEMSVVMSDVTIERPGLAIIEGNQFYAIGWSGSLLNYSRAENTAHFIKPKIVPTSISGLSTSTPVGSQTEEIGSPQATHIVIPQTLENNATQKPAISNQASITIGAALAAIFICLVIILTRTIIRK